MASRFVENLEEVPISHPHLNVSLDDILAEESRKRSSSQSSGSSETRRSGSSSTPSPTSPINTESKLKRAFTIGSKKGRRTSWMKADTSIAWTNSTHLLRIHEPRLSDHNDITKTFSTKRWKRLVCRLTSAEPSVVVA
jgi:hypothetical protein